ncbi:MAG: GNAT family N-acetyltransferase, partial [Parvularculaceae bacterium]|nr:GNAT family N-acetyltransferase [Parvularculaceae bacterium]
MILAGEGFHLRRLDVARDGAALHAIWGDEESCRYMTEPAARTVAETIVLLERWTQEIEDTSWAVVIDGAEDACGRVALIPLGRDIFEAACMIAPAARGRGLAARALALAIDDAFARKGARRIVADVDPENAPSIRTFVNLGFTREGYFRANWKTHIGVRDSVMF